MNMQHITGRLTQMRIPTRGDKVKNVAKKNGFGVWTRAMIAHILSNETYTGTWYYGRTQMISDGKELDRKSKAKCGLGKQVARDRSEWVPVKVPVIIEMEVFEMAKVQRQQNAELSKRNQKHDYLLSGRLRCSKCGYTYVGRTRRETNRYYVCNGHNQIPVPQCDMPAFNGIMLDNEVWEWVRILLEDPKHIAAGLQETQAQAQVNNQSLFDRLNLIKAQLKDQETQYSKLLDLYLTGSFSKDLLVERKSRQEEAIAALRKEESELRVHLQTLVISDEQLIDIQKFCASIREGLDLADFTTKRQILDLLNLRGTLAIENGERILYIKCLIVSSRLPLSVAPTSHSSNNQLVFITITGKIILSSPPQCIIISIR